MFEGFVSCIGIIFKCEIFLHGLNEITISLLTVSFSGFGAYFVDCHLSSQEVMLRFFLLLLYQILHGIVDFILAIALRSIIINLLHVRWLH